MSFFVGFVVSLVICCTFLVFRAAEQDAVDGLNVAPIGCGAFVAAFVLAGILIALISSVR